MRFLPVLFSFTLFFAAFLSFSVQPILGKMLLPQVGGSPAGWIVAMAFFQLALLAGYGISYILSRFTPWRHAVCLIVLYAAGLVFLPAQLPLMKGDVQGAALSLEVLRALSQTILIPFLALTATTAALQRVFSNTNHTTAQDPYYLFVASNIGSFMGLFIYPFFLEPNYGLVQQSDYWRGLYILVVMLITVCCAMAYKYRAKIIVKTTSVSKEKLSAKRIIYWLILAFIPCSLSMGVTNLITTAIGGLPLFWVVPLGLYLLTFIIAFAKKPIISVERINFMHVIAGFFLILALGLGMRYNVGGSLELFLQLAGAFLIIFFVIALSCHLKLAQERPAATHLTLYYLIIATGGALAGMVHAFVVPFLFKDVIEFPLVVILSLLLASWHGQKQLSLKIRRVIFVALIVGCIAIFVAAYLKAHGMSRYVFSPAYFVLFFTLVIVILSSRAMVFMGLIALLVSIILPPKGEVIFKDRNFFGHYAINDVVLHGRKFRQLIHGNTLHGIELLGENSRSYDYGYYLRDNPIQEALSFVHAKTIAVIGLGGGQMACYNPQLIVDFYEIDPDMKHMAEEYFSFISACPPREIIIGDGRRMIELGNKKYDVIMIDAFTSDGIPVHLLTAEALKSYKEHLTPNGLLLFHISNRYLNLTPIVSAIAEENDLKSYSKFFDPKIGNNVKFPSKWMVVPLKAFPKAPAGWVVVKPGKKIWTDDRSSLFEAISLDF